MVKIGLFSFEDNKSTDYKARELKAVKFDIFTQYIRLIFYQPYENKLNIFS